MSADIHLIGCLLAEVQMFPRGVRAQEPLVFVCSARLLLLCGHFERLLRKIRDDREVVAVPGRPPLLIEEYFPVSCVPLLVECASGNVTGGFLALSFAICPSEYVAG